MKINRIKKEKRPAVLLAVQFPCLLSKRGNIHAGKELAPSFHILFLGRKKEVPQLQGLFRPKVLKQYHKRILNQRLGGVLGFRGFFSNGLHIGSASQTASCVEDRSGQNRDQNSPR